MDASKTTSNPNPLDKASYISVLVFWWTKAYFKLGCRKILGPGDLYDPLSSDRSSALGDRLEKHWTEELRNAKKDKRDPSLFKSIFRTFQYEIFIQVCIQILNELILRLGTSILLGLLLEYFKPHSKITFEKALIYAGGISISIAMSSIGLNQAIFRSLHLGSRIRIAVCSVVYRKALRLSKTALGETAPGKIINLVANDVSRFEVVCILIHYLWSAPLLALTVAYFMYTRAGYAGLVGIVTVFIIVPIQSYTGMLSSRFRLQSSIKTDERVRLMDEIILGVKMIKMYAWEKPFCALVEQARRLELKVVRKTNYLRGIFMAFNLFTTRMALFATIITMLLTGEKISADKIYVFTSFLAIVTVTMGGRFVRGYAELYECLVSVKRLQSFLMLEEYQLNNVITSPPDTPTSTQTSSYFDQSDNEENGFAGDKKDTIAVLNSNQIEKIIDSNTTMENNVNEELWSVKLDHVTAKWLLRSSEVTLQDNHLQVEQGKLYVAIGTVGAGKSSLLSLILGEMNLVQGKVRVNGKISYASQEAWVFDSTVRQNILFGQEFDKERYHLVVKACDLQKDLKQFLQGDQTIVGERGSSLSGGQKARINLARAVYRQADIYLLDDPLSAVDAHVGKHLFKQCLQTYLEGKTRILTTHQVQYIKEADSIILVDQGRIYQYSNYCELLNSHPHYSNMIVEEDSADIIDNSSSEVIKIDRQLSSTSAESGVDIDKIEVSAKLDDLMEGISRGVVKGNLILHYFKLGASTSTAIFLIFLFLITQFITSLTDSFIPLLIRAEESRKYYNEQHVREGLGIDVMLNVNHSSRIMDEGNILPRNYYIYIYTAIVLSIFVVGSMRAIIFLEVCFRRNQRLHDLAFGALIRTSMRFFDTNPSGRILNRFSKDLGTIDDLLPKAMLDAYQLILIMIGSIVVACAVNPMFLVPLLLIGPVLYWIRRVYLKTSINIKRLEGITRSPVYTHLNATLNGTSTIRAYKAQKLLQKEFEKFMDVNTSCLFMFISCTMGFAFSLEVSCAIFTSLVTFSFLILKSNFSGALAGLAITQMLNLTNIAQWGLRQAADVTNHTMAVERVLEYADLPPEINQRDNISNKRVKSDQQLAIVEPPKGWPNAGCIKFRNVYLRYREEEAPILKGLNFTIFPSQKVGIVGRTGAGKSSLISAIFRLPNVEGVIEIDGIDIGRIALEDLRRNISIIPQDPVLFSSTLRCNLDPLQEFSDKRLWEVLEEVELKDAVTATGHGLDNRVLNRGSNYSVGQKQLVCLARAILRNNRILMLDEATANVDPHTDALIQHTIRTKFAQCTVLTVAHRLNTIMDSDMVLFMDRGVVLEYDHPYVLLQNECGSFTSLVKETGEAMYEHLLEVARSAYTIKHGENY